VPIYRQIGRDQPEVGFLLLVDLEVLLEFYTKSPIPILPGMRLLIKLYLN
jgi:hypothetical protein